LQEEANMTFSKITSIKEPLIEVCFGWDAYLRQYSGGLIEGLINPESTTNE